MTSRRLAVALSTVLLLLALVAPGSSAAPRAAAYVSPELQAIVGTAGATDQIEAIANYDPALTTGATLAAAIQALGAGTITYRHLDSVAVRGTAVQVAAIAGLRGVTGLYANSRLQYYLHESVQAIGADRAWAELGATGRKIGVAVIDSGIDATHPDLAFGTKTVQNVKIVGVPEVFEVPGVPRAALYVENVANTDTTSGHGTHVAGTIAGSGAASGGYYTGVAKGAHLVGLGAGDTLLISYALAAYDYVLEHRKEYKIRVINNSWGESKSVAEYDPMHPLNRASYNAHRKGITVVFAAGNEGADKVTSEPQTDTMNHFAMPPWVVSVAAGCKPRHLDPPSPLDSPFFGFDDSTVFCDGGELAFFSSRSSPGNTVIHPTLTAPGVNIVAARSSTGFTMDAANSQLNALLCPPRDPIRYTCSAGTSMAAPHVAGAVALMQHVADGALTPDQVKNILATTARPMYRADGTQYEPWEAGAGYLDAYAAVLAARPVTLAALAR